MSEPKLNIKEESSAKKTRSPPKKTKVEQSVPRKKKLKTDAEKTAEKNQHLRFGKAELTPDELSRLSKAQNREMYAAHAARSAVHHEVDQYEDENVGVQALSEGEKAAGNVRDISKSRYARKLKKKAKMQGKKGTKTAKSSAREPTAPQDAGASCTGEGGSNWLSRWKQRQEIHKSYYAAVRSGTAAQTAGGKAASNGTSAARSGVEQAVQKGKTAVSTAVKGLMNAAKGNAHVLVIVGVFLLLILMVMSGFSSCGILFSGGTQVSGQTMYSAEDRDIRGAEQDYKKLEKELGKKIKRTPTDHPGYNEYQYHLDPIEHDPWQLTSFLTTLYDDYAEDTSAGVLRAAMLQKGFDLILVPSIADAKRRIFEDKEIELILCDVELPDGTAMELFHALRRVEGMFQMKNPPVRLLPFFILTENNDLAMEYEYRHEGVNDYITAPVNIPELIRRVLFFVE